MIPYPSTVKAVAGSLYGKKERSKSFCNYKMFIISTGNKKKIVGFFLIPQNTVGSDSH